MTVSGLSISIYGRFKHLYGQNFQFFLEEALKQECECKDEFFQSNLRNGLLYHQESADRYSPTPNPLSSLGSWVDAAYHGFGDRKRMLILLGKSGSGKSTMHSERAAAVVP